MKVKAKYQLAYQGRLYKSGDKFIMVNKDYHDTYKNDVDPVDNKEHTSTEKTVRVKAIVRFAYDNEIKDPGDVFEIRESDLEKLENEVEEVSDKIGPTKEPSAKEVKQPIVDAEGSKVGEVLTEQTTVGDENSAATPADNSAESIKE